MKKAMIIVLALAVLAVALTGASKWPAIVRIYNGDGASTAYFNFEGDEYPIVQLTVAPGEVKVYDFPRGIWDGKLTFCGVTKSFTINAKHNVWLNLPSCDLQKQSVITTEDEEYKLCREDSNYKDTCARYDRPAKWMFFGEPSMEKFNRYYTPGENWKFQY